MSPVYGDVVFAGLFFDVVVYTTWLKRRTPYSIIIGGLSGGMPALAGRALGVGGIDGVGILLALAVLFWIPTHIMTFSIRHADDYRRAGVPTFPARYGVGITHVLIALSSIAAALTMSAAAIGVGMDVGLFAAVANAGIRLALACAVSNRKAIGAIKPGAVQVRFRVYAWRNVAHRVERNVVTINSFSRVVPNPRGRAR